MHPQYLRSSDPGIARVLKAVGVTGVRQVEVMITPAVQLQNTYWSGGGRYGYHLVELETGRVLSVPQYDPPQFGGPDLSHALEIPDGAVVVEIGYGTNRGIRIYAPASTIAKALPQPQEPLSWAERVVLAATAGLKPSYGGVRDFRRYSAKQDTGITDQEYDAAKLSLLQKGLLSKVGSITPEGRNARGQDQLWNLKRKNQLDEPKPEAVRSTTARLVMDSIRAMDTQT